MSLPDDDQLDFDFDELELDETTEEVETTEGEEGNADAGQGDDITDEAGQGPQVTRRERRLQSLANKARDTEQQTYDPRAEQEYIASLDPVERVQYVTNRQMQYMQQTNQQQQYMMLELMDRTAYQTKAASNPVYKKLEPEVEKMRASEASKGRYFNREDILAFLIGQKMLSKGTSKNKPKVTRKSSQVTRPGNTSTDAASGGRRDSERTALRKRMATYTF
jgi:hypothetical protein